MNLTAITAAVLSNIAPRCEDPELHAPGLNFAAIEYEIETPIRQAMWLAQLAHESVEFNRLVESLSYSAERLMEVWPSRFKTWGSAKPYEREPEKLAELVYGGRMGNDRPGDGWKYRGRGYPMLTGKENYTKIGHAIGVDLLNFPQKAAEPAIAARVAGHYWHSRGCNELADADDFKAVTIKINGGLVGWRSRQLYLKKAKGALGL